MYHGRFAPSPTGALHIGSFFTAIASFLDARSNDGLWHLRIDDLDTPRTVRGSASKILSVLEIAGLNWDGPVLYQSQQTEKYQAALELLDRQRLLYPCTCSRKYLREVAGKDSIATVYPGICRDKDQFTSKPHATRIKTSQTIIGFNDQLQSYYEQNLAQQVGDFVVQRRDRIHAYQLAVVVDDASQHISHILRGIDLIESTPRQIYLHTLLGRPIPCYSHVPVVVDRHGVKLSKQTGAKPVEISNIGCVMYNTLCLLNHPPPETMKKAASQELLQWAIKNWNLESLAKIKTVF